MPGPGPDPDNQNLAQCRQKWYRASSWCMLPDLDNPQNRSRFHLRHLSAGLSGGPSNREANRAGKFRGEILIGDRQRASFGHDSVNHYVVK